MSDSFHRRYTTGQQDAVCSELLALRERVFDPPHFDDAFAVASEIVDRSIHNLRLIHRRLTDLGFEFANESRSLVVNPTDASAALERFEASMGQVPLLFSAWYSRLVSVDLSQSSNQLFSNSSPLGGLGWHAELIFQSLDIAKAEWDQHVEDVKRDHERFAKQGVHLDSTVIPTLFTGGCASNNDAKGVELPCRYFDNVLYDDGGGATMTIHEIRRSFSYAGFPVLVQWQRHQKDLKHLIPKPDIDRLLPALTEDLIEI